MNCTVCQYHFCWLCLSKFGSGTNGGNDGYSTHKCNGYYEEDTDVVQSKAQLKRFQWYSDRFNGHVKSIGFAQKELDNCERVMEQIMSLSCISYIASHFYKNALQQIIRNRTVLKSSYIFGFFRPFKCPHVNKNIFENIQSDLESQTENLSRLVEGQTPQDLWANQQTIINSTKVAEKVANGVLSAANDWNNPLPVAKILRSSSTSSKKKGKKGKKDEQKKNPDWWAQTEENDDDTPYDPTQDDDILFERTQKLQEEKRKREQELERKQKQRDEEQKEREEKNQQELHKVLEQSRKEYEASQSPKSEEMQIQQVLEQSRKEYEASQSPKESHVDSEALSQLMAMGFSKEAAENALISTGNNLEQASELLLN